MTKTGKALAALAACAVIAAALLSPNLGEARGGGGGGHGHQRRHVREKATIGHLVQDVYKPKPPDERDAPHSPTTSTGLPVEDQVARNGIPAGWPTHFLTNDSDFTQA